MQEAFGETLRCQIALETGMHSPWVSPMWSDLGHEVIVAHARNVRLIGESRKKDDRFDAEIVARRGATVKPCLSSKKAVDHGLNSKTALDMAGQNELKGLRGDPPFTAFIRRAKERAAAATK